MFVTDAAPSRNFSVVSWAAAKQSRGQQTRRGQRHHLLGRQAPSHRTEQASHPYTSPLLQHPALLRDQTPCRTLAPSSPLANLPPIRSTCLQHCPGPRRGCGFEPLATDFSASPFLVVAPAPFCTSNVGVNDMVLWVVDQIKVAAVLVEMSYAKKAVAFDAGETVLNKLVGELKCPHASNGKRELELAEGLPRARQFLKADMSKYDWGMVAPSLVTDGLVFSIYKVEIRGPLCMFLQLGRLPIVNCLDNTSNLPRSLNGFKELKNLLLRHHESLQKQRLRNVFQDIPTLPVTPNKGTLLATLREVYPCATSPTKTVSCGLLEDFRLIQFDTHGDILPCCNLWIP
ncbi:hypothetical protein DFS34DRAFT_208669 [Phlyctochytrium arcticum]|nr:hypothetical protein DFS34DRAFT_208669 [Phlyctochytrium arcticum]